MRIGRVKAGVAASLLAAAPLLVLQATSASAAPQVTVTPSTGLVDRQAVTVQATGFKANESVLLAQCGPGGEVDDQNCDVRNVVFARADASGSTRDVLLARRVIETPNDGQVDCATALAGTCVVGATNFVDRTAAGQTVTFDPGVAALPRLELTVEFVSVEVEGRSGLLRVVLRCNRPADVRLAGDIRSPTVGAGRFSADLRCDGEDPVALGVVSETQADLRPGRADLVVRGDAREPGYDRDEVVLEQQVDVRPK